MAQEEPSERVCVLSLCVLLEGKHLRCRNRQI